MTKKFPIFLYLLIGILVGCSSRPSSIVTSTSPLAPGVRGTIPAYGSHCRYSLLGLIPVTSSADSQEALHDAKLSADADVLTDVTIDHVGGYYLLFSNDCVKIRGLGVPRSTMTKETAINNQPASNSTLQYHSPESEVTVLKPGSMPTRYDSQ